MLVSFSKIASQVWKSQAWRDTTVMVVPGGRGRKIRERVKFILSYVMSLIPAELHETLVRVT